MWVYNLCGLSFSLLSIRWNHLEGNFLTPGIWIKPTLIILLPLSYSRRGQCERTILCLSPNRPIIDIQVQIYIHTMNVLHYMIRYENVPTYPMSLPIDVDIIFFPILVFYQRGKIARELQILSNYLATQDISSLFSTIYIYL